MNSLLNHSVSSHYHSRVIPKEHYKKKMATDILEPLSVEKWQLLAETLKINWPANVQVGRLNIFYKTFQFYSLKTQKIR